MKRNKMCLFAGLFFWIHTFAQQNDLFDYTHSKAFADYLYKNAEYIQAIQEYKRVLFLNPYDKIALMKIQDSYIQSGLYADGLGFLNTCKMCQSESDTLFALHGKMLILNRDFIGLNKQLQVPSRLKREVTFLQISRAMYQHKWSEAQSFLPQLEQYPEFYGLLPAIQQATTLKYKDPRLSLIMSTVIPGSGKAYSGYWKDGLFSFLFIGVTAWQSYRGFSKSGTQSVYGWLMGGISLSFYTGNLYGSYKSANKTNHNLDHQILDSFEKSFLDTYSNF
ncbi:MAG: hypothetical protein IPM71_09400 [Bacteroidota bacterium]|nr:MAG: hypothetical protein IPM71_09400 [Bacteroidota bacterium]